MPPRNLRFTRPAFSHVSVIVVLVIVLAGLLAWKASIQYGLIPANHPMASSARGKVFTSAVTVGLGSLAIAGGIAAACYFLTRRSTNAALLAMAITMVLPVAAIGYQLYNYQVNGPAPKTVATPATPPPRTTTPPPNTNSAASLAERTRQDMEKSMQALNQLARGQSPTPSTTTPPPTPNPSPTTAATPTAPRATPPATKPKQPDPNVQKLLDELRTSVTTQITTAITAFEPAVAAFSKPPRSDLADLRKRTALIKTAREALAPIPERLRNLSDDAKSAAEKGGSENSLRDAIEFNNGFSAAQRAFAADQLIRLLDQAASETQLLLDNYGRWKVNKEGQIESKDFQLQSSANSDRFFIKSSLQARDDTVRKLKGE